MPAAAEKIAYLSSHYPAVSHSFVLREVEALRALRVPVETISIRRASESALLTAADAEAAESTFAVLPISAVRLIQIHSRALLRHPSAYLRALLKAMRMAGPGVRASIWQLFYFAEAVVVFEHCERRGIGHIHAQFADSAIDVAMIATSMAGDSMSWSVALHGPVEFYNVEARRLPAKAKDARFVQTISNFGRSQVLSFLAEPDWSKVHVVHCGVDPTVYAPTEPGGGEGALRVLCVGRLVHHKGQSLLVRAVAELRQRGVEASLTLVGDGPSRKALEGLVEELDLAAHVHLAGAVGQDSIRDHYLAANVFCLPSFAEGIPVVLMEAMALERPVVTTTVMGIPELVEDGVSGLVVPPGDLTALVDALGELAADPARRSEMGRAGRRKVVSDFDVRQSAALLRDLFMLTRPHLRLDADGGRVALATAEPPTGVTTLAG